MLVQQTENKSEPESVPLGVSKEEQTVVQRARRATQAVRLLEPPRDGLEVQAPTGEVGRCQFYGVEPRALIIEGLDLAVVREDSEVVRPWVNGSDITRRPRRMWVIDFPPGITESDAALYEAPFEHIKKHVEPMRKKATSVDPVGFPWWVHGRPRPDMRQALHPLPRYVATPILTKYRHFVWLAHEVLPDHALIVFARSDDYFFGVLHSHVHEVWARGTGTQLREAESGFRYTPTTCFESFPFPQPAPEQEEAIAAAAEELNRLREGWLNPPPTSGLGLPDSELKKRTLTNLYNDRPTWLVNAHAALDNAVFAAYGWSGQLDDSEILARLLDLNLQREPA